MKRRVLLAGLFSVLLAACNFSSETALTPTVTSIPFTATAANTLVPTLAPTATPVQLVLLVTKEVVNCRLGPGVQYDLVNELEQDETARAVGRNVSSTWWYVRDPGNPDGYCWLSSEVTSLDGDGKTLPLVHPPGTMVTSMNLTVDPNRVVVECTQFPQTFYFNAEVTVDGPTLVNWQWEASTGAFSDVGTIIFEEAGTKLISEFYQVAGPNDYWVKLHILNPNQLTQQANFRVSCTP
jgi:hypothetical protein